MNTTSTKRFIDWAEINAPAFKGDVSDLVRDNYMYEVPASLLHALVVELTDAARANRP